MFDKESDEHRYVVCTAESFYCLPETITALLTGYAPMQKRKSKIREKIKWAFIISNPLT